MKSAMKLKLKDETEAVLRLSSNMVGSSNDESNFLDKLLLTSRHVANLCKAFANNLLANIKLSKTQLSTRIPW